MTGIQGYVADGFGGVADAFGENFAAIGEDGAAVSVYVDGILRVDIWRGHDPVLNRPLARDSLTRVASCSKGITATCLAILVEDGLLDPLERVSSYWPEFAQAGKADVTVEMVASHQAGLPFPTLGCGLTGLDYLRGDALTAVLAAETPWWPPGTAMAYHPVTVGALLDEIVKRATGQSISQVLQTRIAGPLGLDMWIALPEEQHHRVVPGHWVADDAADAADAVTVPAEPAGPADPAEPDSYADRRERALAEHPSFEPHPMRPGEVRAAYSAQIPAIGAITDARSLARMYAATIGSVDGHRLFSEGTRRAVTRSRTAGLPALIEQGTAGPDLDFGLGYQLSTTSMPGFGPASFGHTGAGGRLGIAHPDLGVALGYTCNRMRNIGAGGDPRWATLIAATAHAVT